MYICFESLQLAQMSFGTLLSSQSATPQDRAVIVLSKCELWITESDALSTVLVFTFLSSDLQQTTPVPFTVPCCLLSGHQWRQPVNGYLTSCNWCVCLHSLLNLCMNPAVWMTVCGLSAFHMLLGCTQGCLDSPAHDFLHMNSAAN